MNALTQDVCREEPAPTGVAFDRLLEWLDDGVDSHGSMYLECLERCLQELNPDQRALVVAYYRDERRQRIERRRDMAKRLGITMNALSIRVGRIRTALEASVETCRKERRLDPRVFCEGQ